MASDAVSEAFVQAMSNRQEIREPKAWIWATAFKLAAGEMARGADSIEPPDLPIPEGVDPDSVVDLIRALRIGEGTGGTILSLPPRSLRPEAKGTL